MTIRANLYHAAGDDREVDLDSGETFRIDRDRLLWIDLDTRAIDDIDGLENARELLVGSFDLHLGRASQRTNDVMKVLTLVSAIALPGIVRAGVMGMNFKLPFFDEPGNFFVVVAAMVAFSIAILGAARWRHWI